jgi:RHS repeat-associated protein
VAVTNQTQNIPGISRVVTAIAADNTCSISDYLYGQLASVTRYNATGAQIGATSYAYDPHERQSTVTDARNGSTTYGYNNANEVNAVRTPAPGNGQSAATTTTLYDNRLRSYSVIQPDETTVDTEYLPTGQKALEYGSRTYPVAYGYDYAGRLAAMTNWSGFNSSGGSRGTRVTTWTYDSNRGWLNSKAYDDGHGPSYTYTAAGRLASRTWARGITTSYAYDTAGSLTNISYSDTTPGVTNSYDRLGRLTAAACNGMTDTLTYNLANELLGESFAGGPLAGLAVTNGYDQFMRRTNLTALAASLLSRTIYGYDAASRLATVSDANNNTATYSYLANSALVGEILFQTNSATRMTTLRTCDYLNRLTEITSQGGTGVPPVAYNYNYNAANQRTQDRLADGSYWNYQYDALGQVTSGRKFWADGTVVAGQQFGYAFDTIGNRTQTQTGGDQNGRNLRVANYTANDLNQITSRDVPGYVEVQGVSFATNQVAVNGNTNSYRKGEYFRQEVGVANGSAPVWTTLTVTATNQAATTGSVYVAHAPENFTYDLDGDLTNDGRWAYIWDAENRLIRMTNNTGVGPLYNLAFAYDSKGRRIQKIETTNGVAFATNTFLYDGWNLVAELGTNNTLLRNYTWGNDLSGSAQGAGGVGGLLEATYHGASATTNAFVAYDGNGNVGALVNAVDGTLLANYEYGPFGEAIRATGPMAKVNPFRFSTKYQDDESDLLYYGHRYYKPSTGTWMSRDLLGDLYFLLEQIWATKALQLREHLREGANLPSYLFVKGDPISQIDILGLSWGYDSNPNYTWAMPNKYNCGAGTLDGYIQVWLGGGKKNIKSVDDGSLTGGSDKSGCPPLYSTGFSFGDTPGGFIIGTGIETEAGSVAGEKVEVCHVCLATCCAGSIKNSRTTIPLNGYKIVKIGPCASYTLTDIPGEYDLGSYGTVSDSPSSDFNQMVNGKSPSALGGGCFACQH